MATKNVDNKIFWLELIALYREFFELCKAKNEVYKNWIKKNEFTPSGLLLFSQQSSNHYRTTIIIGVRHIVRLG